jgi:hypothetical protein
VKMGKIVWLFLVFGGNLIWVFGCQNPDQIPLPITARGPTEVVQITAPFVDLSTAMPQEPDSGIWIDLPSYYWGSLSEIPSLYQIRFDPNLWSLEAGETSKEIGYRLVLLSDSGCMISPHLGRGLGPDYVLKRNPIEFGNFPFLKAEIFLDGKMLYATYCGGEGQFYTCYLVQVDRTPQQCLDQVEAVLDTLTLIDNPFQ